MSKLSDLFKRSTRNDDCPTCHLKERPQARVEGLVDYAPPPSEHLKPVDSQPQADKDISPQRAVTRQDIAHALRGEGLKDSSPEARVKEVQKLQMAMKMSPEDFRMAVLNDVLQDKELLKGLNNEGLKSMQASLRGLRGVYHPNDGGINSAQLNAEREVAKQLKQDPKAIESEIFKFASQAKEAAPAGQAVYQSCEPSKHHGRHRY